MSPKTKKLTETVEKINEKHGEEVVITASELSEKDKSPTEKSGTDNNCYTDFSSASEESITQKVEKCKENLSIFKKLSEINVNDRVEYKNKMRYLSWAYAWGEAKKHYPYMTSKVYETETGCNYFTDQKTCWVKVGVTIEGLEHIEYYPVTDYRNTSIPFAKVTSFDVNTAIQRGLTKALARHGLGLYIYAGEDLPEQTLSEESKEIINTLICEIEKYGNQSEKIKNGILATYKIRNLSELTEVQAAEAINKLQNFKKKEETAC